MIPNALLPIALLASLAIAVPSPALDPEFRKNAKRAIAIKLAREIELQTRDGGALDMTAVEGLLSPEERQLLGGGDEYAPYQVPCPTGWNWVRSADVCSSICTARLEWANVSSHSV